MYTDTISYENNSLFLILKLFHTPTVLLLNDIVHVEQLLQV